MVLGLVVTGVVFRVKEVSIPRHLFTNNEKLMASTAKVHLYSEYIVLLISHHKLPNQHDALITGSYGYDCAMIKDGRKENLSRPTPRYNSLSNHICS
jgi:hypothetical protein